MRIWRILADLKNIYGFLSDCVFFEKAYFNTITANPFRFIEKFVLNPINIFQRTFAKSANTAKSVCAVRASIPCFVFQQSPTILLHINSLKKNYQ